MAAFNYADQLMDNKLGLIISTSYENNDMHTDNIEMEWDDKIEWVTEEVDEYEADTSFTRIVLSVPKGTEVCTQKVAVDVRFKGTEYGRTSFTLNVIRGGLF